MKKLNSAARVLVACFCLLPAGCATTDLPKNLPSAEEAMIMTNGAWIILSTGGNDLRRGEFIALDADTLFLMEWGKLLPIPRSQVKSARIFLTDYPLKSGGMAGMILGGVISSAAVGWYAVFAAPAWLLIGSMNSSAVARDADKGDYMYPPDDLKELGKYARFPQGMPAEVKRSDIRPISIGPLEEAGR
jgi:hypothetical protein